MQQLLLLITDYWQVLLQVLGGYFYFDTALLWQSDMLGRLALQLALLICSAFFSSAETALFSLSRLDLQQLRAEQNPHSITIHELLDQPRKLIISILSGNELVNVAATANMAFIVLALYGAEKVFVMTMLLMVPLFLLFGEVTPKTIAVSNPVRYSTRVVARPLWLWMKLTAPLRWAIRGIADRVTTWLVGETKTADNILQVDEFLTLLEQVSAEGVIDATERALIYNLLEANETEIVEVMTPRTQMAFLNVEMSVPEMVEKFIAYRHPRVPVFKTHRDNLVGFVHAEDVLRLVLDEVDLARYTPEDIMHAPVVVPLTKKVDEMFDFFQVNRVRAAACLNEFGGVEGFITMRGVLSFMFGDISGGSRATAGYYAEKDYNIYEVPGDMKLNDFDNLTNFGIEDSRMTTIGGYSFRLLDRLPMVGDRVNSEDIIIQIVEMDDHRIARVRVAKGLDEEEFDKAKGLITNMAGAESELDADIRASVRDKLEEIPEDVDEADVEVGVGVEIESADGNTRIVGR